MRKLLAFVICILMLLALVSCGDDPCSHRDADDNSLCDNCGESYTDGKDLPDEPACSHRDADDNSLCDKCGESYTDGKDLPDEHTHSYTVKNTDSKYLDKAADCEKAATYFYSCSCGKKGTTTFTSGSENGHSYTVKNTDSKYLDKAADCENAATYFYSCSCGDKGNTTFIHGDANGHSYVIQNVDPKYEKTPASEYTPAVYWKSCACGKASTTETFTHGDMLPGYLTYQLSNDSSFYIVTGFVGVEENITIPHIYDALPVFGIMANAFKNNTTLKSITMPNSIQEIGSYAFAGCTALESVSIPTSVKSIFSYTFSGCTSLKTITLHSGIEELGAFAFENCTALKSITLNEGLKTISNNAFDNCSSLEGITIPDTVTILGNMAFRKATSLKYVIFSKALESIGNSTFQFCASLESVELHENITTLGNSTFSDCRGLKTLRILGNLESIGFSTFYDCRSLTSIYFASKTPGDCGNTNYIFYNAGIEGDGITLTIAKDAIVPDGFFTPYVEDNIPKITSIIFEEGTTKVEYFKNAGTLPYLKNVTIPISVTHVSAKALLGCADLTVNMVKDDRHYFGAWYDNASFSGNAAELNAYAGESEYLYAKWIPYSISIDKNIDVAGTVSGVGSYIENAKVTVTAQTNDGYTFLGWYENGTCVSTSATYSFNVNKATFLTAMWEANTYTITFDADGGTTPKSITVTYNENYTLPETNKTGYTFDGWFNGDMQYTDDIWFGLSSITLKAKWTANTYNVTFDDTVYLKEKVTVTLDYNYVDSTNSTITLTTNGETLLYPTIPIRDGYSFAGWYIDSDCTTMYDFSGEITEDITIYANWVSMVSSCYSREYIDIVHYNSSSNKKGLQASSKYEANFYYFTCYTAGTYTLYAEHSYGHFDIWAYNVTQGSSILSENFGTDMWWSTTSASVSFAANAGDVIYIALQRDNSNYSHSTSTGYGSFYVTNANYPSSTAFARLADEPQHCFDSLYTHSDLAIFGNNFTLPTLTKPYHNFLGWYNGETKVESGEWNIAEDVTLVPKFEPISELKDFTFTYSDSGVQITGVVDKTKTSYVIPDCVTSIANGAFRGCSSVESMTLPFVGGSKSTTSASSSTLFGYIFGTSSYTGGVSTKQYYGSGSYSTYYIPSSLKSVTITGGNILYGAFYNCSDLTSITIGDNVTSICDRAFYNCTSLTSVTIPNSVTSIGNDAFYNCTSLTGVYISDITKWCAISFGSSFANPLYYAKNLYLNDELITNLAIPDEVTSIGSYAFSGYTSLASIEIPDSVRSIGFSAFYNCDSLTSVTIGNGVTSIGEWAFSGCDSLTSITVDENNSYYKSIDGNLYSKDGKTLIRYAIGKTDTSFTVSSSVTSIGDYAFAYCDSLTSIEIPDNVTSIGNYAFRDCTNLTSVTIGNGVTSIGGFAFSDCTNLASVTIGNGVTSIGESAFSGCDGIMSITIPDSVTSIGEWAFSGCDSLTSVTIGNGVTSIGNYAFYNCTNLTSVVITDSVRSIGFSAFYNCDSLTSVTIPDSVTSIVEWAFRDCNSLTSVTIGDSVTSIGSTAFSGCTSLTHVTIGDSVTSIGSDAFRSCSSLTSVTIPDSVTSIGSYAFYGCSSLTSVTIPDSVTSIGERAFCACNSLTSVTIGSGVTSIGNYAFRDCTSLTSIKYRGDEAQWNTISKGSNWDKYYSNGSYYRINYTITYNYEGE